MEVWEWNCKYKSESAGFTKVSERKIMGVNLCCVGCLTLDLACHSEYIQNAKEKNTIKEILPAPTYCVSG